jgi:small-conductance mechanosensitive channel
MTKNLVLDCGDECSFKLADGRVIRNLNELSESLENMDDNVFRHHVNDEKNDLSNWARDVLADEKLAENLTAAKDRNIAKVVVLKRIIELIKEIAK